VDEAKTERIRSQECEREKQIKKTWQKKHLQRQALEAEAREQAEADILAIRSKIAPLGPTVASSEPVSSKNPNSDRFAVHQRQGKHTVIHGDTRPMMLSRVFLNGKWIYAA